MPELSQSYLSFLNRSFRQRDRNIIVKVLVAQEISFDDFLLTAMSANGTRTTNTNNYF
jgi:hypothetical protein